MTICCFHDAGNCSGMSKGSCSISDPLLVCSTARLLGKPLCHVMCRSVVRQTAAVLACPNNGGERVGLSQHGGRAARAHRAAGRSEHLRSFTSNNPSRSLLSVQGQPVRAVQWGVWAGAGMAAGQAGLIGRLARQGYGALNPADGLAVLGNTLAGLGDGGGKADIGAALMAAPFHWARFLTGARVWQRQQRLLAELLTAPVSPSSA